MRKAVLIVVGLVCLVVGIITAPTPLPTGVPLIALSLVILVGVSPTARRVVRAARNHFDWFHHGLAFVEARAARRLSTPLRRTRPLRRRQLARAMTAMVAAPAAAQRPVPPA